MKYNEGLAWKMRKGENGLPRPFRDPLQMIRHDRGVSTNYIDTIYFIENSLSNGPGRKETTKRNEHAGIQKGANFTIASTTNLIGLDSKFYETFAKQHLFLSFFFSKQLPYIKILTEFK